MKKSNSEVKASSQAKQPEPESNKKVYQAPQILSVERLEAAAAACDPPTGGFGKTVGGLGSPCTVLGS